MHPLALLRPLPDGVGRVSQWFGANPQNYAAYGLAGHEGLDYACSIGSYVLACHDGVVEIRNRGVYGLHVLVVGEMMTTYYCHLSKTVVVDGDTVAAGQMIGESGNTGRSTGPHLHVSWLIHGVPNPAYKNFHNPLAGRLVAEIATRRERRETVPIAEMTAMLSAIG
jgi:murein DD-endopeptidase MepM/ murein hydrolase activator NlpD